MPTPKTFPTAQDSLDAIPMTDQARKHVARHPRMWSNVLQELTQASRKTVGDRFAISAELMDGALAGRKKPCLRLEVRLGIPLEKYLDTYDLFFEHLSPDLRKQDGDDFLISCLADQL